MIREMERADQRTYRYYSTRMGAAQERNRKMYDANEKMSALSEGMRLIERIKDEIAGMGYIGLENDLIDLMADFDLERRDLQDAVLDEYREQEEEQEREYYAAAV